MFFTDEELRVAEKLAWEMLDGRNHSYMPGVEGYAHFYYNGQIVFDPWMNEKSQGLTWPDHESKEFAVNPVEYYGQKTIEEYLIRLFLRSPEYAPKITEKIKRNLGENGRLRRNTTDMPVEVYIAMPKEQAREEKGSACIEEALPDSQRIYFEMVKLPAELTRVIENGWKKEVVFLKKDAGKVFELLYPDGASFDFLKMIKRINGKEVRLIGFGD